MRIDSINLSWFRGAGESITLEPHQRSIVVYGSNGAGKSTFADALEYIVAQGKIRHLAHEYSGKHQELGLRNIQAPAGKSSLIDICYENEIHLTIKIPPNGIYELYCDSEETLRTTLSWNIERFILRQDEVANFIHATKGGKYSVLLPLLGLETLEQASENIKLLQKSIMKKGKLERKEQRLNDLAQDVLEIFPNPSPKTINQKLLELAKRYIPESQEKSQNKIISLISSAIQARIEKAEPEQQLHMMLKELFSANLLDKFENLEKAEKNAELMSNKFIDHQISILEPTRDYLSLLDVKGEKIECPACGREIKVSDFSAHVTNELLKLKKANDARITVIKSRKELRDEIKVLQKRQTEKVFSSWLKRPKQRDLRNSLQKVSKLKLDDCNNRWDQTVYSILRGHLPIISSALAKAVKQSPPSTQQLVEDSRVISIIKTLPEIKELSKVVKKLRDLNAVLIAADASLRETITVRTKSTIERVSGEVQRLWSQLHPDEPIENVQLYIPGDAEKAIDICLKFYGVDQPSPRLTLSEGHRNSLGLCLFLALVLLSKDKGQPIILDDVVSSFDREHRGRLADVLLGDLSDRQIILLTHDREWYAELRSRLPSKYWDFYALRPWEDPQIGIQLSKSKDTFDDAKSLIKNDPEAAGNRARAIMDTQLAIISERLHVRLPYARGDRNDRRTCMEFLERITSEAKNKLLKREGSDWVKYVDPIPDWKDTLSLLVALANRASHTGSLTSGEAERLIYSCEKAIGHFRCSNCGEIIWFADQQDHGKLQCSCGDIIWKYD